ncbi:hypothetical protein [Streptomyces sp. NPDC057939]|uniref:hypothetical protein n=1 Tax=Streptomyces sp. NPDC057939 TaxID=3346284 RepID=UPI0036E7D4E5
MGTGARVVAGGAFGVEAGDAEGEGRSDAEGDPLPDGDTEAEGDGGPLDGAVTASQAGGDSTTVGAERATGGVCRVEPTTNWTVASTAVTLVAVHDSHMNR